MEHHEAHGHHHHHHADDCATDVHAYPLVISGKHVKVSGPTATGLELKLLGDVPEGNDLFLRIHGGCDQGITDHQKVELKDCEVFYDLPPSNLGGGAL